MMAEPDPRTAADDDDDITNRGISAEEPAEGPDSEPAPDGGSPAG